MRACIALLAAAVIGVTALPLAAQVSNGRIEGAVMDPAGAVAPNANVTVPNNRIGDDVPVSTNEAGYSLFPHSPFFECRTVFPISAAWTRLRALHRADPPRFPQPRLRT